MSALAVVNDVIVACRPVHEKASSHDNAVARCVSTAVLSSFKAGCRCPLGRVAGPHHGRAAGPPPCSRFGALVSRRFLAETSIDVSRPRGTETTPLEEQEPLPS